MRNGPLQYTYDNLGRMSQVMVQNGGAVYEIDEDEKTETDTSNYTGDVNTVSYQYASGGRGENSASTRVTRVVHSGLNVQLDYAYDELGNIISESCDLDGNTNQYRYDKLGQLVQASVRNDTTCGANGTTWVYTYDLGGNILQKEGYPKLTDIDNELPETPTKVVNYTYDTEWKDLLTSYDGKPIQYTPDTLPQMPDGMTYFHAGNPYKFDGWTYEWQAGRQLKSMTHKDALGVQDKKLEFSYDAAGLRTQKKYTYTDAEAHTVVETTDYNLHGKLLTHQKTTTTVDGVQQGEPYQLHLYYDAASKPIMVRVGNEEAQSKYHSYIQNLQGDILGIVDKDQDLVVEYAYDPWGKPLETRCLKTECEKLASLNPFQYRGYQYDEETGLYYLRSRYYSPERCRFITKDSIMGKTGRLLRHNLFAYCYNMPNLFTDGTGCEPKMDEYIARCYPQEAARINHELNEKAEKARWAAQERYGKWYMGQQRAASLLKTLQSQPVALTKIAYLNFGNSTNVIFTTYLFAPADIAPELIIRGVYATSSKLDIVYSVGSSALGMIEGPFGEMCSYASSAKDLLDVLSKNLINTEVLGYLDNGHKAGVGVVIIAETNVTTSGISQMSAITSVHVYEWTKYLGVLSDFDYQ